MTNPMALVSFSFFLIACWALASPSKAQQVYKKNLIFFQNRPSPTASSLSRTKPNWAEPGSQAVALGSTQAWARQGWLYFKLKPSLARQNTSRADIDSAAIPIY